MPTYTVTTPEGCLDDDKRGKIAREITRVHHETTGAPAYFAQVLFVEIKPGRYFVGGGPLKGKQVFVNGQIRAGRTAEMQAIFNAHMATPEADAGLSRAIAIAREAPACLLCLEAEAHRCHRAIVAEAMRRTLKCEVANL